MLLHQLRNVRGNGFVLWDATQFVMTTTPMSAAINAVIAQRIAAAWAAAPIRRQPLDPNLVLQAIETEIGSDVADARPGVIRYVCEACSSPASLPAAAAALRQKVDAEAMWDTGTALERLTYVQRKTVSRLAHRKIPPLQSPADLPLTTYPEASLWRALSNTDADGNPTTLLPPYAVLFRQWIDPKTGALLVKLRNRTAELRPEVRTTLNVFYEHSSQISADNRASISVEVLQTLAEWRVGVSDATSASGFRPPTNVAELDKITALLAIHDLLPSAMGLRNLNAAKKAVDLEPAEFESRMGWELLLAFRHLLSHATKPLQVISYSGINSTIIASVAHAAASELVVKASRHFYFTPEGALGCYPNPGARASRQIGAAGKQPRGPRPTI